MKFFDLFKSVDKPDIEKNAYINNVPKQFRKEIIEIYGKYPETPYMSPDRDFRFWIDNYVKLFGSVVPITNMKRLPNGLLAGHILMLWRISFDNFSNKTTIPTYFEYEYGVDGKKTIHELITGNYIKISSVIDSISTLKKSGLTDILEKHNIKYLKSANKARLIENIANNLDMSIIEKEVDVKKYELTNIGSATLNEYSIIVEKHKNK